MSEQLPKESKLPEMKCKDVSARIRPDLRCIDIDDSVDIVVLDYEEAHALRDWLNKVFS